MRSDGEARERHRRRSSKTWMVEKAVEPAEKKLDSPGLLARLGVHVALQRPFRVEEQRV